MNALSHLSGLGAEVAEDATSGAEYLQTRDQIDAISDALLERSYAALNMAELNPRDWLEWVRVAKQYLALGIAKDAEEDRPCQHSRQAHQRNEDRGRQVAVVVRAYALPEGQR